MNMPTTPDHDRPTRLFLDTEWADDDGRERVSIAIVGAGEAEFYAERDPLPRGNAFTQEVLYSRRLGGAFARRVPCIARTIADFIERHHGPPIIATRVNDFILLDGLLACAPTMPQYTAERRFSQSLRECIRLEFTGDPSRQAHRHNARVDARVLRDANAVWSTNGRPS